jgi:multidrug efflux pump subunit AcrA (membrane-fusion protein)
MNTPRIRSDLHATPAEEGGIRYFDVSDPKSGARMRMYDFEWLIAERMDGRRPFDEVASWARERLGIQPSPSDLEEYARRLRELGFIDLEDERDMVRAAPNAPTMMGQAPGSGNGAGRGGEVEEDSDKHPIPPLVAEGGMLGNRPPPEIEAPASGRHLATPSATAPTMAMPTATAQRAAQPSGAQSNMMSILGIAAVVIIVGGIVAYVMMGGKSAKVATVVVSPREVVRLYDGTGTVKKSEGQTLSFGEAGKVTDIVAAGTEAKAGMPLATLDGFAKIEKELADVKDRAAFYEKQLATAKAKGDAEGMKAAEAKVAEKKKLLGELEARAAKVRLVAPGPATVMQVMLQAGAEAKPGEPVVKLADKRNVAEFKVGAAEAARLKPGQPMALQPAAGGAPMPGRVARIEGDTAVVELSDEASAKIGDNLRLVRARVPNVVTVPAAAVVKRGDGSDVVFVLANGVVHERRVTVVDRSGADVLIGGGLANGDQVVASGAQALKDGQKASP